MTTESKPAESFGTSSRTFDNHLRVQGALRDFSNRQLKGMSRLEGCRERTAYGAKDHLLEALALSKEVLPFGPPCDGFDFTGSGCPGQDTPLPVANAHDLVSMEAEAKSTQKR